MGRVQVLVATMNQSDFSKLTEMNIQTDVVFANQANDDTCSEIEFDNHLAKMITTATRGVGINRNIALENASNEIVLIADDDIEYVNDYEKIVLSYFDAIPKADAFIFNIESFGTDMHRRLNRKVARVRFFNSMNYGAVRLAVRLDSINKNNIRFNTNFGGGTMYSSGEDSLFIADMLKNKMKIYVCPSTIAVVDQTDSSWFRGYNDKYFYDKGALFNALCGRFAILMCLQDLIRHYWIYRNGDNRFFRILKLEMQGVRGYRDLKPYKGGQ